MFDARVVRGASWLLLGLILGLAPAKSQGTVVALKRDAGLTDDSTTNAVFNTATVVTTTVSDTTLYGTGTGRYLNYGIATPAAYWNDLFKFDLSSIPAGSTINLAQLRLHRGGGNGTGGNAPVGTVLTHDWTEGTKNGAYPGLSGGARGASLAHPNGKNTTYDRNSEDGTTPPLQSWGATSDQFFSMAGDVSTPLVNPTMNPSSGAGWHVYTVTSHVQAWVNGTSPNYGWAHTRGSWTFDMSEAGTANEPVLFVDYTAAPVTPTVTLSVNPATMAENGGTATLTATLSRTTTDVVTVNLAYSGTATTVADYTAAASITINPGELTGQTVITAVDDQAVEDDETVIVDIDSVTNATEIVAQRVTATINDDDAPPSVTLSVNPATIAENGGTATLTATLSRTMTDVVTVNLAYSGTATTVADYTAAASVTINSGELTGQTTLTAADDEAVEGDETVIVDIDTVTNAAESGTQQVAVTITDDDTQAGSGTIALKRDAGLTLGGGIDSRFNSAAAVSTTVGDNSICMHQNARWMGAGKNTISGSGPDGATYVLFKFDVSAVPACSHVNLAQLRLYTAGTGCSSAATILTHDWKEGPGTGVYGPYPGATGGVSFAHPIGYQTAAHRNAQDGTTPPEASWGLTSDQFFTWGTDTGSSASASANSGGYYVINVTSHVQAWVSGVKPNYGWALGASSSNYYMSENTSDRQPVLFIDYSAAPDPIPPATVADLAVSAATSSEKLTLTWTAPGDDGTVGTATGYEIRYSKNPINTGNWGSATPVPGVPAPQPAGTAQSLLVSGLASNTTYYFAMKALDEVPNGSALAVASGTTLPDTTPPAAVADLAVSNYTSDTITLRWTAPGDDGTTSTAASYDIRYSTSPINNDTDWTNATQATGEPIPWVAGTVQSMVVTGLAYDTTYYLAIKTIDEVGNVSALSNLATQKTLQDPMPPVAVADLAIIKAKSTTLTLSWTAPGDDGAAGKATSYDIRYSRSPIDDANWDSATQVTGEPAPRDAGKQQTMILYNLVPSATYYVALKTSDEVPNVSVLSNVATGQTLVNIPINKALLCKDDFEYRGSFALPETVDGVPAGDPSGIAVRRVNGQLRMLTGYSSPWGNPVVEVAVPDPSTWKTQFPWPEASLVYNWARSVYGTNTEPYYGTPGQLNDATWGHGMTFDPATNRFYFSWGNWYNVAATNNNCLAWADLSVQGAPVVHGPWKDNAGTAISQRIRGGSTIIPDWFADAYLGGRNLGLGFGGPWSGLSACSIGPYLIAVHHPADGTNDLDTLQLLYYPYSPMHFCTRDANYVAIDDIAIPPVGDVGYWTDVDNIWGGGCWIDLPDKQGMMYFVWWGHGDIAYIDGNPKAGWSEPVWMVYDPADLALVAQGQMNSWAPGHDDWSMTYTPSVRLEFGYSMTDGVAFDAQTRTLFVKQKNSYQSGNTLYPLIHAWHIKESPLPRLIGDINNDTYVNVGDLQLLVAAWGSQAGPPATAGWNADADINMDSYVNVGDLQLLVAHWGEHP